MTLRPFSLGDRVRYVSNRWGDTTNNPLWGGRFGRIVGTVDRIRPALDIPDGWVGVRWDNGCCNSYDAHRLDLQHHSNQMEGEES